MIIKRFQQAVFEAMDTVNRPEGSGSGTALILGSLGFAAAGNQGAYSTANSSTFTDIANTSYNIHISRPRFFEHRFYVAAHLSAAGGLGYVRVNIVGFDVTASLLFGSTSTTNGFLWYMPLASGKGMAQPGDLTAKLQAATDNAGFTITIDQFFHQTIPVN